MNAAAAAFLASFAPGATDFTFQTFDDSPAKRPELACVLHGSLEQHGARLLELNKAGAGVFVVVNETDGTGRKAANVTRVRAVFADFDKADPSRPGRLAAEFPPTLLVESSPGKQHAYWAIDGALPLEQFKPLQRAIAASLGSDPNVCDLPRVMRLPGFHHRKGEPHLVRLLADSSMRRYTPAQVCARFPVKASKKPAKPEPTQAYAASTLEDVPRIAEALRQLEPLVGDQGTWLKVLAALNLWERSTPGAEGIGEAMAREWSALWDRFDADEFEARYHSFRNERDGAELVTLGSLFHLASQCRDDAVAEQLRQMIRLDFVPPVPAPAATVAPTPVGLVEVSLADVMTAPLEPVSFAVAPWLPRRHVTLLGGHGGMGKSSLALAIGAHVACGRPFAGLDVERLPVLFVSLEDEPRTVRARLRRTLDAYHLPAGEVLAGLRLLDGTQGFSALFAEDLSGRQVHTTAVYAQLAQQVQGAGLVLIDNASDAYEANENSRQAVRGFIRALAEIARANDAAVVLLAHIDKNAARGAGQGNNYSGSTAWHNSARSRLALIERDGRIWLEHEKANLSRRADPVAFSVVDGVLMPDAPDASGSRDAEDQAAILAALRAATEAGEVIPDNQSTGQYSPANLLRAFPEFVAQFGTGRDGKDRASAAIVALKRAGLIRSEKYRSPDRREKARLVPVPLPHSNGPPPDT